MNSNQIFTLPEVLLKVRMSRSSWLKGVKNGSLPAPIRLSPRRVGWTSTSIDSWIAGRVADSKAAA